MELLWYTGGGSFPDAPDVFDALSDELASMGRNYSVRFESFDWADYTQKMQLIITSGEKADIVFMSSWTGNYFTNAAAGYLTELDGLLDEQPKLQATMGPQFWNAVRVGGKSTPCRTTKIWFTRSTPRSTAIRLKGSIFSCPTAALPIRA